MKHKRFIILFLSLSLLIGCYREELNGIDSSENEYGICLHQDSCFDNQVKKIMQYQAGVNFDMKKKMILSLMADHFLENSFELDCSVENNTPPAVMVSFKKSIEVIRFIVYIKTIYGLLMMISPHLKSIQIILF